MSMTILGALQKRRSIFHTALDDLESFLWLLIWCIVHVSKDIEGVRANNPGIDFMLDAWSGGVIGKLDKHSAAETQWKDVVFGGLIKKWLKIFTGALDETWIYTRYLSTHEVDNGQESDWTRACDQLESCCKRTYEKILRSGFEHLESVRMYPDWKAVVAANEPTMDLGF
jgi:hypothetical protein